MRYKTSNPSGITGAKPKNACISEDSRRFLLYTHLNPPISCIYTTGFEKFGYIYIPRFILFYSHELKCEIRYLFHV